MAKKISILGSTGSIGRSTLDVVRHLSKDIEVVALAARSKIEVLEAQVKEFHPQLVAVYDSSQAKELSRKIPHVRVVPGMEGLQEVAALASADIVVSAMSGSVGVLPTISALNQGKVVALANKEVLVCAGEYVMKLAREKGATILPVDSEHSALFQCLGSRGVGEVRRMVLTASGGPFLHVCDEKLESITVEQALNHPNWKMGPKVTVDSSTMMNKGLEVIEAHFLFGIPIEQIEVVIHPQSVIHSMVEWIDGSIIAQMSEPSMFIPIQYALTYPKRNEGSLPPFDFCKARQLEFLPVPLPKFVCLNLAFESLRRGGNAPCYLSAANEVLVERFIEGKISWIDIQKKLEKLFLRFSHEHPSNLETFFATEQLAREQAFKE